MIRARLSMRGCRPVDESIQFCVDMLKLRIGWNQPKRLDHSCLSVGAFLNRQAPSYEVAAGCVARRWRELRGFPYLTWHRSQKKLRRSVTPRYCLVKGTSHRGHIRLLCA